MHIFRYIIVTLIISLLGCAETPPRTPAMTDLDTTAAATADTCVNPKSPKSISNFQYGCFCGKGHPKINQNNLTKSQLITAYYKKNKPKDDIDKICRNHDICWIHHGDGDSRCNEEFRNSLRRLSQQFSDQARIVNRENWGNRILTGRCGEENERPRCKWMRCKLMASGMADAFLTLFVENTGDAIHDKINPSLDTVAVVMTSPITFFLLDEYGGFPPPNEQCSIPREDN